MRLERDVKYLISTRLTVTEDHADFGYHDVNKNSGRVKIFVSNFFHVMPKLGYDVNDADLVFCSFVEDIIRTTILERVCVERAFNKARMRKRCEPFEKNGITYSCKMDYVASMMYKWIGGADQGNF